MVKQSIVSWHFPHSKNSKMGDWPNARVNIRPGIALASKYVLELTAHALEGILQCQECYSEHKVEATMNDLNHT